MSESSGPHTVCKMAPDRWNAATAGKDIDGVETKIFDPDVDGEGEVCVTMEVFLIKSAAASLISELFWLMAL